MSKYLPDPQSVKAGASVYVTSLNLAVVPVNGKIPEGVKGWQKGGISTMPEVERVFRAHHNIGIVTGRYEHDDQPNLMRLWVLDVDWKEETIPAEGEEPQRVAPTWGANGRPVRTENTNLTKDGYASLDALTAEHGPLPATWTVRTGGGGTHFYFRIPEGMTIPGTTDIRPFIDIRGQGGQVVAPPSTHPETGADYYWEADGVQSPPEAPAWLLDIATEKERKRKEKADAARAAAEARRQAALAAGQPDPTANPAQTASRDYALIVMGRCATDVTSAAPGTRHTVLFSKTFRLSKLYGNVLTEDEIVTTMTTAGLDCGLPEGDVERTVNNAYAQGEAQREEAYPVTPVSTLAAGQTFMQNLAVLQQQTRQNSTPPPPPPTTPPSGGGAGTPPPPPPGGTGAPPPAAAPPPAQGGQNAPLPTSRNAQYPVDPATFRAMSRRPDTFANGVITRWGSPKGILANISVVFRLDPAWVTRFWYNELSCVVMYNPPVPLGAPAQTRALRDSDVVRFVGILNEQYNMEVSVENVHHAINLAAEENRINPVGLYLTSLTWDGVPRIDTWLQNYMGVQDTPLARKMGRKWLIASVARALDPGCKADAMLIVKGPQNAGKSTAFRALAGSDWFNDTPFEMDSKDRFDFLRGVWVYEIAELTNFTRADANALKGFLSSQDDKYRPAYGRTVVTYPRRVIFCGTTNEDQFLMDSTGTRRFWVVESGPVVDVDGIKRERDQLWAEAVHAYRQSEEYWLDRSDDAVRADESQKHTLHDPLLNAVAAFCADVNNDQFTADTLWRRLVDDKKSPSSGDARRISKLVKEVGTHTYGRYTAGGTQVRGYYRVVPHPPGSPQPRAQGAFSGHPGNFKP